MPRPDLLPSLSAGSIDVACGGVAATNQRRLDGFAFTSGIFLDHEALVVPGTDTNPYTSLEELRGQPVGAQPGTPFFGMVQAAGVDLRPYPDLTAAFQGLAAGEIKAAVFSIVAVQHAQEVLGQGPGTRLVETYSGAVPLHNTLGVRRGEYELLGRLQDALETLKAEGNLDLLLEKWGLPAPPF
jgi:polar amino acid transport system substrate-binding protein